jgi:hypothetical protein
MTQSVGSCGHARLEAKSVAKSILLRPEVVFAQGRNSCTTLPFLRSTHFLTTLAELHRSGLARQIVLATAFLWVPLFHRPAEFWTNPADRVILLGAMDFQPGLRFRDTSPLQKAQ